VENFVYNWNNKYKFDDNLKLIKAIDDTKNLRKKGYKREEAEDLLLSKDMDSEMVKVALDSVYERRPRKQKAASRKLPTSYEDLKPFISDLMHRVDTETFVDMVTIAEDNNPIVQCGSNKDTLYRLVEAAKIAPVCEEAVHQMLSPWFEEELLRSVEAADKIKGTKTANKIRMHRGRMLCTCDKFMSRHYADFGLVCEHIINNFR